MSPDRSPLVVAGSPTIPPSPVLPFERHFSDGVPRVSLESLVAEGRRQQTIGMGGNRGALVHLVDKRILRYRVHKQYVAPRRVSENEIAFMSACYRRAMLDFTLLPADQRTGGDSTNDATTTNIVNTADATLKTHLVVPDALVMEGSNGCGILMPLFHANLFHILSAILPTTGKTSSGEDGEFVLEQSAADGDQEDEGSVFRKTQEFRSISDPIVIAALLYQMTKGVATLNYGFPHGVSADGEQQYTGFSHNDLHLANILVHYDTGSVVLCDFELVEHLPPQLGRDPPCDRVPCRARHPPFGLWQEHSDAWGLGLLACDLLTGVIPLIHSENAFDDFGDGPLLVLPSATDIAVIDWEANLEEHVSTIRGTAPGSCPLTDELYAFCKACLSNTVELEENPDLRVKSKDLLKQACFKRFESGEMDAAKTVKDFLDLYAAVRPNVVTGRAQTALSKETLMISTPSAESLQL